MAEDEEEFRRVKKIIESQLDRMLENSPWLISQAREQLATDLNSRHIIEGWVRRHADTFAFALSITPDLATIR